MVSPEDEGLDNFALMVNLGTLHSIGFSKISLYLLVTVDWHQYTYRLYTQWLHYMKCC